MNKKNILYGMVFCLCTMTLTFNTQAQQTRQAAAFHGATAVKKSYKAVFQLNSGEDKVIRATLRNMNNALHDPRLEGKLTLELVAHSGGIAVFLKKNAYGPMLQKLAEQGVILAACENTLRERQINKSELLPFVSYVPSGNGELIIRQQQGWAIIHP